MAVKYLPDLISPRQNICDLLTTIFNIDWITIIIFRAWIAFYLGQWILTLLIHYNHSGTFKKCICSSHFNQLNTDRYLWMGLDIHSFKEPPKWFLCIGKIKNWPRFLLMAGLLQHYSFIQSSNHALSNT